MPAFEALNDHQMREHLEKLKEDHGVEFHQDGSIGLPTGHRVPSIASIDVVHEPGITGRKFDFSKIGDTSMYFNSALLPETGAVGSIFNVSDFNKPSFFMRLFNDEEGLVSRSGEPININHLSLKKYNEEGYEKVNNVIPRSFRNLGIPEHLQEPEMQPVNEFTKERVDTILEGIPQRVDTEWRKEQIDLAREFRGMLGVHEVMRMSGAHDYRYRQFNIRTGRFER